MRVRFCYCFVPFKMKGTNIWGKVWKQEQFLVKARVKAAAKFMDLGKTKDFSIFCSASGNTFLTNAFNWSGLVFPCLRLGIKLYRNHCIWKYLCCKTVECEVVVDISCLRWNDIALHISMSQPYWAGFFLACSGPTSGHSEFWVCGWTSQLFSHSPEPFWIIYCALREGFYLKPDFRNEKEIRYITQNFAEFFGNCRCDN